MNRFKHALPCVALLATLAAQSAYAADNDRTKHEELYIGDRGDDSVKVIDAQNGNFLRTFIPSKSEGLAGPAGMIFRAGNLLLVNQNAEKPFPGEVLRFDQYGKFIDKPVDSQDSDDHPPFFPRGIIRGKGNTLYVADVGTSTGQCSSEGRIARYDADGNYLGDFDRSGFTQEFHPRGLVIGPDGLLYVSAVGCLIGDDPLKDRLAGYVLRFNPATNRFIDVFAAHKEVPKLRRKDAVIPELHRPEGLVFDREGNLWITSFRADQNGETNDNDRILKLDGKTGRKLFSHDLAQPVSEGGERAFAQALLFGPDGDLFIPISGNHPNTAGQVRRCKEVKAKKALQCRIIVPANNEGAGGPLVAPEYLIFEQSNPSTLNFDGK